MPETPDAISATAYNPFSCLPPADQSSRQFPRGLVHIAGLSIAPLICCELMVTTFNAKAVGGRLKAFPMI